MNLTGKLDGSREVAAGLHSFAEPLLIGKGFLTRLGFNREQIVVKGDVQVFGLNIRDLRFEEKVVFCLRQLQIGLFAEAFQQQGRAEVIPKPVEKAVHVFFEPVDLLVFP
jgi:hypothetical protein